MSGACVSVGGEWDKAWDGGIVYNCPLWGASQSIFLWPILVIVVFLDSNWCRRRRTAASHVAHVESHICHVAEIVYSDSCSFVYSFVLYCEMEMALWQCFINLQDACNGLVSMEEGNQQ